MRQRGALRARIASRQHSGSSLASVLRLSCGERKPGSAELGGASLRFLNCFVRSAAFSLGAMIFIGLLLLLIYPNRINLIPHSRIARAYGRASSRAPAERA